MPVLSMQHIPRILAVRVLKLSMLGRFTPTMIAFIWGIPLPAACGLMNWIQD